MTARDSDTNRLEKRPARRFPRRTVRIQVEYESPLEGPSREYATTLGAGGLFIASEQPLPRKSRLKLGFSLPGGKRRHEIEGLVVWTTEPAQPGEEPRTAGMGIQFTDRAGSALLARELESWEPTSQD